MDWLHDVARTPGTRGVRPGREPAQPRGRPAVLRHHLHLLRTGRPRRTRGPRRTRPPPARHTAAEQRRPTASDDGEGADGEANRVGFRTYGKSKDSRDDLPADRDRDGGHPRRDPGAGVVLARQHQRLRADPPGQGRHAGLDPVEDRVGRRPRVLLRAQPPLPAPGRSRLHHRREAALRLPGDQGRPVAAGPLHRHRREHAGQGGEGVRHRAVRDLPQPRRRHARRAHPRAVGRPTRGADRRIRQPAGDETRRAAREDLDQARPEPVPAGHPRRAAAHRQGQDQDRGQPGREVPAALLGPAPARPPTSRWATSSSSRSNAAGGT